MIVTVKQTLQWAPSVKLTSVILVATYIYNVPVSCKRTNLEYLKAINVKDSDTEFFIWFLDGFIYGLEKVERARTEEKYKIQMNLSQFV